MNNNVSNPQLKNLQNVIEITIQVLNGMQDRDRTTYKALGLTVATQLGVKAASVQPLVNMAVKQYSGITILRGRAGGIIKGVVEKKALIDRPCCGSCKQVIRSKKVKKAASETIVDEPVMAATVASATTELEVEFEEYLDQDDNSSNDLDADQDDD